MCSKKLGGTVIWSGLLGCGWRAELDLHPSHGSCLTERGKGQPGTPKYCLVLSQCEIMDQTKWGWRTTECTQGATLLECMLLPHGHLSSTALPGFSDPAVGVFSMKQKRKGLYFTNLKKKNHTKKLNKCYLNPMSPLNEFNTEHRSILKPQDTTKGLLDHLCGRPASDVALPKNPSEVIQAKAKAGWQLHPSRKQLGLLLSSMTSITTTTLSRTGLYAARTKSSSTFS